MNLGEVYFWKTDKAKGHALRDKFHIFICLGDWEEDHTFLFISSDDFGGDYRITNPPYTFLTKPESFISCSSIVTYDDNDLKNIGSCIGQLSVEHIIELRQAIANSNYMTGRHIKRVCNAITDGLK